jgi:hypothetical protein
MDFLKHVDVTAIKTTGRVYYQIPTSVRVLASASRE